MVKKSTTTYREKQRQRAIKQGWTGIPKGVKLPKGWFN
jgi:hypothetical protein